MDKKQFQKAIDDARKGSPKRKFSQTFDFIANLQDINLKKPEEKVDLFIILPNGKGKKAKVCALVDDSLINEAKKTFAHVIHKDDFQKVAQNKAEIRRIARNCDYFIAQANLMPEVASSFGKVLGPKGKMPNPKAGGIIPPKAALGPIQERLNKLVRLQTKNDAIVKCSIGKEEMKDEDLLTNLTTIHNALTHALPKGDGNIKSMFLKLTMGKPSEIGAKEVKKNE